MADTYRLKLMRKDKVTRGGFINMMNLQVDPKDWPEVSRGLEALKKDNPDFTYEAVFLDRIAVSSNREQQT
ncbi:hypothetical protein LCGC14_1585940 [marine sediment metagenome]|uniref:Uncharacterized protein n=1 Tax=marine sediment metagenome TaxID=412755 RepID=A0A0F9J1J0_9ZZZZ